MPFDGAQARRWNVLVGVLIPVVALAASIVPHSLAERAAASDRVALVQVLSRETVIEGGDVRRMRTVSKLAVARSYKGSGPDYIQIVQQGGKSGLWEAHVPGDATLEPGQTALVFLRCPEVSSCSLVALGAGALPMDDGQLLVMDLKTNTVSRQTLDAVVAQLKLPGASK